MKMDYKGNRVELDNEGINSVVFFDNREYRKRVWKIPDEWRFFIKMDGEFIEVYRKAGWYSVFPYKEV
jgi:hypothetical protein